MADLLPCPFCGGTILTMEDERSQGFGDRVRVVWCRTCHAVGPSVVDGPAEPAWNRRSPAVLGIDLVVPPNADETK